MRITRSKISNFKGLKIVEMNEIGDMVILAGPNGSGKSSILEAIGYAKEAVVSYSNNNQIYNRLGTSLVSADSNTARIELDFEINEQESGILHSLGKKVNEIEKIIVTINKADNSLSPLESQISDGFRFLLKNHGDVPNLGLMDYIDAHRIFHKQPISEFNFSTNPEIERQKRFSPASEKFSRLKYTLLRLKTMDSFHLHDDFKNNQVSEDREIYLDMERKINKAFELLSSKKFNNIDIKSNPIKFNVQTPIGNIDIDELSSGEKEIIFILLELLALNLNNSILLFDEPDLHLSESVQQKFIEFIKSIGNNNQIWLTTHSSSIINDTEPDSLFRVQIHNPQKNNNQVAKILDKDSKLGLLYEVLGTKSILTLGEKIVFLEGALENDKFIFDSWFDSLKNNVVFVNSGSVNNINKITETNLYLLGESTKYNYFYCIRDGDLSSFNQQPISSVQNKRLFTLKRYHIENYLLDEEMIFNVIKISSKNPFKNSKEVYEALKKSIERHKNNFILKILENKINTSVYLEKFSVKGDFNTMNKKDIEQQIDQYEKCLQNLSQTSFNSQVLVSECEKQFNDILKSSDDQWKIVLPGRDILKYFIQDNILPIIKYNYLRDSLVEKIKDKGVPKEIESIVDTIVKD